MTDHGEIFDPQERARAAIFAYHQLPQNKAPGSQPFETYNKLHRDCEGAQLTPEMDLTAAWLEVERYLAMPGSVNPRTQKRFRPHEINAAKADAIKRLTALSSPEMPTHVRIEATLAAKSMPYYSKLMSPFQPWPETMELWDVLLQHSNDIAKMAAENLDDITPELGDELALLALINEVGINYGIIALPAPPRQAGAINGFHDTPDGIAWTPIDIADEPRDGVITIRPKDIGNGLWADIKQLVGAKADDLSGRYEELPAGRNATLQALALTTPGTVYDLHPKSDLTVHDLQLQVPIKQLLVPLAHGVLDDLNQGRWYAHFPRNRAEQVRHAKHPERRVTEPQEDAPTPELRPTRPEALWYLRQSRGDMDDTTYRLMLINLQNLTEQESQEQGLLPLEHYALGGMRLEHAQRAAAAGDYEQAVPYFNLAAQAFAKAAEAFMLLPQRPGMACESLLAYEGALVQAEAMTNSDPEAIQEEVVNYTKRLAMLSQKIREHEASIATNEEEAAILHACAERTTLALLLLGATDATLRHLVLPVNPRGVGYREQLTAYLLDMDGNYATNQPIAISITEGQNIHPGPDHLTVGRALLASPDDRLSFLEELANAVVPPPEKPSAPPIRKPKKKPRGAARKAKPAPMPAEQIAAPVIHTRTEAADELSGAIANGIADAADAGEEARYIATLGANARKRYLRERGR
ncbi:MAG TPA: hypothetical protein VLA88_02580 [Candidatus Saccharimonadales bacterium]|nr:hypothetical protein [Candidatus Saccharimonadales bacterium]